MKIRTPRLMVAEKTSKLEGNQFLKVTDVRYLTFYAKTKFQTNVSKANRTTNANIGNKCRKDKRTTNATLPFWSGNFFLIAPFPDDCLLLHFHALVDVYFVFVTCLSLGLY